MTRNQIYVLILALCLIVVANEANALPDNYCTADQKTTYTTKIEKIDTILTAWNKASIAPKLNCHSNLIQI